MGHIPYSTQKLPSRTHLLAVHHTGDQGLGPVEGIMAGLEENIEMPPLGHSWLRSRS